MDDGQSFSDTAWAPPAAGTAPIEALLPGYRDFTLIARGGDSVVYRAHQIALDRDVAVKIVLLDDEESIARFRRELAITVRLGRAHPNIMTVLDTGTTASGQPCLVMDHVELGSLHDRLGALGPLPVSEVVAAGSVIADALAFAHGQGVLHRDVKPQNVLVLPTSWVLADFGLARAIDAGHSSSLERFSYRHASPQVLDGLPPTVADDIYSLGSTMFTLLDGRAPFAAEDPDEDSALSYLRRARTELPRTLARDDVPAHLAAIVQRCLAREPADRFPDAASLRDALSAVPTESRSWEPPASTAVSSSPIPEAADPIVAAEPPTSQPVPPPDEPPMSGPVSPPDERAPDEPSTSALAQLGAPSPPARDGEATGLRPTPPPPEADAPALAPAPSSRRRWIGLTVLAVVLLVGGIAVGIRSSGGNAAAPVTGPTQSAGTDPSASTAPNTSGSNTSASNGSTPAPATPTATGSFVRASDPRITTYARSKASSVLLGWTDPGHGRYQFVVFEIGKTRNRLLTQTGPGVIQTLVPDVSPGHHCFLIGMLKTTSNVIAGPPKCKTT